MSLFLFLVNRFPISIFIRHHIRIQQRVFNNLPVSSQKHVEVDSEGDMALKQNCKARPTRQTIFDLTPISIVGDQQPEGERERY